MLNHSKQLMGFLVVALWFSPVLAATTPPPLANKALATGDRINHYVLIMSGYDAVCKPLLNFYNAHITDRDEDYYDSGFIEDRFGSTLRSPGPVFLLGTPWWHQLFQNLDIYNNSYPRTVIINDFSINVYLVTLQSQLLVIKPNTPNPFEPLSDPHYISEKDPALEQWIDFTEGGSSIGYAGRSHPYLLHKYPGFDKLLKEAELEKKQLRENSYPKKTVDLPSIGQSVAQRLLTFQGKVFFSAREWLREPKSKILIYTLNSSGIIDDVCYFEWRSKSKKS